ncbi:MAG: UDP-3-O-acyl-N-acetylglucosamine deacetylase [Dictyoglomus sp.]|nr:UDP-3-O-acyl-N-acetylglucosamine deacetylase [Dictyoglomus sp.]MCX7942813.1 UDP-3-O-acyl-N-acetylglucosamine deacetylase [Dictyoglomaceae bacterium]MDW8188379.1 UDP-3-O-acyl-N-acetylglucosamine deacetylase [Dictyoglomus sp.]
MNFQRTIKKEIKIKGYGLHKGKETELVFLKAPENTGIIFIKDYEEVPAFVDYVVDTQRGVSLGKNNVRIMTVEHLLSAIYSLKISNLFILVKGEEIPILDGSSLPFIDVFKKVGILIQESPLKIYDLEKPILEKEGRGLILLFPSSSFAVTSVISFPNTILYWQKFTIKDLDSYEKEIAFARTFGFWYEIDELRKRGLIRGGSLENALLVGAKGYENKPRSLDEPVRHKILDILGDFALLGGYLRANIYALSSGHALHVKVVKRLLQEKLLRGIFE